MHKISVIIVGGSGAVGNLMTPFWFRASAPVLLQYRHSAPIMPPEHLIKWDPGDGPDNLSRWASNNECLKSMIVLAGVTPRSGRDLALNTKIVESCLKASKSLAIPRVIVASSSAVYGDYLDRPFSEDDIPHPVNAYGEAKLAVEQTCARWSTPNLQITCLRIGNVAGADALLAPISKVGNAEILIDRFKDGGTPLRSYIGPGTLSDILLELAEYPAPLPPILNVGEVAPIEMGALADAAGVRWRPKEAINKQAQRITLNCSRLWSLVLTPPIGADPGKLVSQLNLSRMPL